MARIIRILVSIVLIFLSFFILTRVYYNSKNKMIDIKYKKIVSKIKNDSTISDSKEESIINNLSSEFKNDDIKGTIKIGNNLIDTIYVQTNNNDYYLKHSIDKKYNVNGTVFLDYRNNIDDKKLIIYGHSYRNSTKKGFSKLFNYKDKTFYENNKYITLNMDGNISNWIIFSSIIVKYDDNNYIHTKTEFINENDFMNHINWIKENSLYETDIEVTKNDRLLTIQTCYFDPKGSYFIINAKEIKEEK